MTRVDRAGELSRLEQTHAAETDAVLVVTGEAGLGKTYLLEQAARELVGAILVRANPAESHWEYSGVSAMLTALEHPDAQTLATNLDWVGTGGAFGAAQALLARLFAMKLPATTVMIDDVDVMDAASQALLGFLARRLQGTGLRLILGMVSADLAGPFGSLPLLSLTPLDPTQSIELARRMARPGTDPATIQIVAIISAGIPVYLREGLEALTESERQGRDPLAYPVQFGPRAAAASRALFAAQDEASKAALRLISTAPVHHEQAVREILGVQQSAVDDLLAQRILLRTGDFLIMRQAVLRCATYVSLAAVDRQELHSQLHKAHRARGSNLSQWHSSFLHDGETSPRMLVSTALELVRQGSSGLATAYADRAILLLSFETEEVADLLCELGAALVDMGELAYSGRYLRKAMELVGGNSAVRVATAHQQVRSEFMTTHEVDSHYVPGMVKEFGAEQPDLCVQLLSMVAVFHGERWEVDEAKQILKLAVPLLEHVRPEVAFEYRISAAWIKVLEGDTTLLDQVASVINRTGAKSTQPLFVVLLARCYTYAERYEQAWTLFDTLLLWSPALDPLWLETARFFQAENEIRAGRFLKAIEAVELLHAAPDVRQFHLKYLNSMRAWYWLAQGEGAQAQPYIDAILKDANGSRNSVNAVRISALLGRAALSRGEFATALRHLLRVHESGASRLNPTFLRHEPDLIEVLVAMGRSTEARRFLVDLEMRARRTPSPWATNAIARCRGLVAEGELSLDLFRQAIKIGRTSATAYERGRTLLCFSERLRELGYLAQSDQQKIKARALFDELSVPAWGQRQWSVVEGKGSAKAKRFAAASKSNGSMSLVPTADVTVEYRKQPAAEGSSALDGTGLAASFTAGEYQVVVHVLEGLRNKEIAALLEVSLRTVETRLTNVYKKTGASSRAHLVALINEETNVPRERGNVLPLRPTGI